jgi:hypothetical protein
MDSSNAVIAPTISISQHGDRWYASGAGDQDALEWLGLKARFEAREMEMVLYGVLSTGQFLEAVPEEL